MADLDEAPDQALDEALDQALQRFQLCGLEYFGGLANHGPMAAEALCRLGHAALIPGLIDVYAPRLPPLETGCVISEAERISSLGDPTRLPDWVATFDREIQEQPGGCSGSGPRYCCPDSRVRCTAGFASRMQSVR